MTNSSSLIGTEWGVVGLGLRKYLRRYLALFGLGLREFAFDNESRLVANSVEEAETEALRRYLAVFGLGLREFASSMDEAEETAVEAEAQAADGPRWRHRPLEFPGDRRFSMTFARFGCFAASHPHPQHTPSLTLLLPPSLTLSPS